jgi:dCMP deaminase
MSSHITKWDHRFLDMAKNISDWSKDPSTKVGSIAVDPIKKNIISTGYNGFPRGILDAVERYEHKPTKYKLVVHSEMNLIYNATFNGVSLNGSTLYVYGLPVCSECAKGIIQVGVKRVVMWTGDKKVPDNWQDSWVDTENMFKEAGVQYALLMP